jgi:DNA-binding NarL/FixJ family response regulator
MRVFLVDDDRLFLRSLSHYLQQSVSHLEIREFYSGEECLESLHLNPQLIILDYQLSEKPGHRNGLSILKSIRNRSPRSRTIILSSSKDMKLRKALLGNAALAFIPKNESAFELCHQAIVALRSSLVSEDMLTGNRDKRALLFLLIGLVVTLFLFLLVGK